MGRPDWFSFRIITWQQSDLIIQDTVGILGLDQNDVALVLRDVGMAFPGVGLLPKIPLIGWSVGWRQLLILGSYSSHVECFVFLR